MGTPPTSTSTTRRDSRLPGRRSRRRRAGYVPLLLAAVVLALTASGCIVTGTFTSTAPIAAPPAGYSGVSTQTLSCAADDFCMAGGGIAGGSPLTGRVQVWDGTSWAGLPSPIAAGQRDHARVLRCWSESDCLVVFDPEVDEDVRSFLSYRWNGSGWTAAPFPTSPSPLEVAGNAGCAPDGTCLYGSSYDPGPWLTYDDGVWTHASYEDDLQIVDAYGDVECASEDFCIVARSTAGPLHVVDGVVTPVAMPFTAYELTCATESACFAYSGDGRLARWDGTAWTETFVSGFTGTKSIGAISCASATECIAIGTRVPPGSTTRERLVLTWWGGTEWTGRSAPAGTYTAQGAQIASCVVESTMCMTLWTTLGGYSETAPHADAATYTWSA